VSATQKRLENLRRRDTLLRAVRSFFWNQGFTEVQTPVRIPGPLPEAHIHAVESGPWFLHPSPEACMKRLVAAGSGDIFTICPVFRANERGTRHLPEFILLEWYRVGADYTALMEDCEGLFLAAARALGLGNRITWQGMELDLTPPWDRLTVAEAFRSLAGMEVSDALAADAFDETAALVLEPRLGLSRPVFLMDYPVEKGSLAKRKEEDPAIAERFEVFAAGLELANGFSELTDPEEQRQRFVEENRLREEAGLPPYPPPETFLDALSSLPPCAGIALGVDRLAMLMLDAPLIDDVVSFRPEEL